MTDYSPIQKDSPTVQMRVCSSNVWGLNCTPPNAVDQATGGAGGSGGGGGRGGGGGGGYGSGSPITGTGGTVSKYV
jgi:hypothetical protein